MLNKEGIYCAFGGRISKKAIQLIDDEWRIVGKWCYVTQDDEHVWDIWICNPADIAAGLGQRKVRNMLHALKSCVGEPFHELTGEAWGKVRGTQLILNNLAVLGIRKKRTVSEKQRNAMVLRLAEFRKGAA